jgi:two-component system response regulator HydG
MTKKILVIDDDADLLSILQGFLKSNGFEVVTAGNGKQGLKALERDIHLVLCDIKLPDFSGLDILSKIKKIQPHVPVIMITGYSDVSTAVEALRRGARDYVTKPLYPDEILHQIKEMTAEEAKPSVRTKEEPAEATAVQTRSTDYRAIQEEYLPGESDVMLTLEKNIELVAPTDMSVVILGDTGSGKEFVAKRLHQLSNRNKQPFVSLDCGALPPELAGSELFGHKKGAFTGAVADKVGHFELADGGTLFLDEVGNLSYDNQIKLLRVLQERKVKRLGDVKEKPVDFRLVVATNENLQSQVRDGKFREDLYYRLNEFSLVLPPIRNRGKDVLRFTDHFLKLANAQLNRAISGISDEVKSHFMEYSWPGNLRELKNVVKRAVLVSDSDVINKKHIPAELMIKTEAPIVDVEDDLDLKTVAERAERAAIIKSLKKHHFNKTLVAKALNIDRKTLYNKINAYDIEI